MTSLKSITEGFVVFHADGALVVVGALTDIDASRATGRPRSGLDRVIGLVWRREQGAACVLGARWRSVDDERVGLLFDCDDGLAREVVLRADPAAWPEEGLALGSCPHPGRKFALESVGGERASICGLANEAIEPLELAPWEPAAFSIE